MKEQLHLWNFSKQYRQAAKYLLSVFALMMVIFTFPEEANAQKITIQIKQGTLDRAFQQLIKQSNIQIVYNTDVVSKIPCKDFSFTQEEITNILDALLIHSDLEYKMENGIYMINNKTVGKSTPVENRIIGKVIDETGEPLNIIRDAKQKILVSGTVFDSKHEPLPGVTVSMKSNATRGTVTNQSGEFTIESDGDEVLIFSFIGFQSKEFQAFKLPQEIIMEEKVEELTDVVITGIFTRRAESFTGSAQTFNNEDLRKVGNGNVLQSLKNLDPSFKIVENVLNGSNPNILPEIQLRGQSGFPDLKGEYQTDPNQPLFILDGFEAGLTKIMDMDMNRIESLTLLKDAAAKAIYGSKAANGVVVIETRRPKSGKMQTTYTGSLNIQDPDLKSYDLANAAEKLQIELNAGLYDYLGYNGAIYWKDPNNQYTLTSDYNRLLQEIQRGVNTDWKAQPVRTGIGQKHSLYLEGGDDFYRFGVDFSYNNIKGVMKGSDRTTYTGGMTLSYRYKNFLLRDNLEVSYNKANNSPWGSFSEYTQMNPYLRPRDENGNVLKTMKGLETFYNPMWNTTINTKDYSKYSQMTNNFYIEWLAFQGLKLTGRLGFTLTESGNEIFHPASHTDFYTYTTEELLPRRGRYSIGDGNANLFSSDINAQYSKNIGKHLFFANAGWNLNTANSNSVLTVAEGFPNDNLDHITFAGSYLKDAAPTGSESTTHDVGALGAFNYSFDDRYLFDASIRYSGSSQFGSNNRWGKFYALGIGWNLHNEPFLKQAKWLNQLKLRASTGYTGSQGFNSYQALATYSYYISNTYDGNVGAYLLGLANNNLQWQRKQDKNIGIDISVFDKRLSVRGDYYRSNTDDLLTDVSVPYSTGFTSYRENLGEVQNNGFEFRLNYRLWADPKERSFFSVYATGIHNLNKIIRISNSLATFNDAQAQDVGNKPVVRYEEGQSLSAIWAVPSLGIDPSSGKEVFIKKDGSSTFIWNSDDMVVCGDSEANLRGNFGFNMNYKNFSLNVGMTYRLGGQVYNQTLVDKVENANLSYNVDRRIFSDRWVNPGDVSRFKDIADQSTTYPTQRFVEDNDSWELSSVNISYDFDSFDAVKSLGFNRLRLLFDITDVARLNSVKVERGTAYPFAHSFSFSLQAMF
jgi:TonB-linked SusC/RagA family outer membrane protein